MITRALVAAGLVLMLVFVTTCDSSSTPNDGLTTLEITNSRGETVRLRAEIADDNNERGTGLSKRESLGADQGMLFDLPERGPGFWMKDTLIPLSVAFLSACGEIVAIEHMQPLTLDLHNTDRPYRFGLEVNQGWFEANHIALGDYLKLSEALRQPGC